jgi:hypothetical protein
VSCCDEAPVPRSCTICRHEQRAAIDAELAAGTPRRAIASRYGVDDSAVWRHREHVAPAIAEAQVERHAFSAEGIAARLDEVDAQLAQAAAKAKRSAEHVAVATAHVRLISVLAPIAQTLRVELSTAEDSPAQRQERELLGRIAEELAARRREG